MRCRRCLENLLTAWLEHIYFAQRPPKSLPRSEFGPEWIARAANAVAEQNGTLEDLFCTLMFLVIRSLAILRSLPKMDGSRASG
jgi:1,6-anhydro-N-acetylmuramate kinase